MAKLIDRSEVLKSLFPLGIPPDDWDYCVSAHAVYDAIMSCKEVSQSEADERLSKLREIKERGFAPKVK